MTSKQKAKDTRLRKIYKTTLEAQDAQLAEQNNACAICGRPFPKFKAFQDHFHGCCPRRLSSYCGRCNRGILCFLCNKYVVGVLEMKNIPIDGLYNYIKKWGQILKERGCYEKKKTSKVRRKQKSV